MSNVDKRITKALIQLLIKHRFYGVLARHLRPKEDPVAACGTMSTDGQFMYYDPKWIDTLTPDEIKGVIVHEISHCAYKHHTRRKHRGPDLWNIACDFAINYDLHLAGFKLPAGGLITSMFHNMSAEEIYTRISGDPRYQKCPWGRVLDAGTQEEVKTKSDIEWSVRIKQAAAAAGKGAGSLPAGVKLLLEHTDKPWVDWRQELRAYFDDQVVVDVSWSNPSKRYLHNGLILPSGIKEGVQKVGAVLDTSGSIYGNPKVLPQFMAECQELLDMGLVQEFVFMCCDAAVVPSSIAHFHSHDTISRDLVGGGGGTRFSPAIDWFNKNDPDISVLLYFTDLECWDFGREPDYPVIWCAWGMESDLNQAKAPFGTILKLLEHE